MPGWVDECPIPAKTLGASTAVAGSPGSNKSSNPTGSARFAAKSPRVVGGFFVAADRWNWVRPDSPPRTIPSTVDPCRESQRGRVSPAATTLDAPGFRSRLPTAWSRGIRPPARRGDESGRPRHRRHARRPPSLRGGAREPRHPRRPPRAARRREPRHPSGRAHPRSAGLADEPRVHRGCRQHHVLRQHHGGAQTERVASPTDDEGTPAA